MVTEQQMPLTLKPSTNNKKPLVFTNQTGLVVNSYFVLFVLIFIDGFYCNIYTNNKNTHKQTIQTRIQTTHVKWIEHDIWGRCYGNLSLSPDIVFSMFTIAHPLFFQEKKKKKIFLIY